MRADPEVLISHWERAGLLDPGQAARLRADLPPPEPEEHDGLDFSAAVSAGLEALGYLGAALVIGALVFLFDVASWSETTIAALLAVVAVGCGAVVARRTPAPPGPESRLVTALGSAGLFALVGCLALLVDGPCSGRDACDTVLSRARVLVIAVPGAVAAAWLYLREQNAVTHLWAGVGVFAVAFSLAETIAGGGSSRSVEVLASAVLLPASLVWTWASETERLRPAWIGTIGSAGVLLSSSINLVDWSFFNDNHLAGVVSLMIGMAYAAAGTLLDRWRLTTIGALILLWSVPWTLTEVLGLSTTVTALVMLPVGIGLLAFAGTRLMRPERPDAT